MTTKSDQQKQKPKQSNNKFELAEDCKFQYADGIAYIVVNSFVTKIGFSNDPSPALQSTSKTVTMETTLTTKGALNLCSQFLNILSTQGLTENFEKEYKALVAQIEKITAT